MAGIRIHLHGRCGDRKVHRGLALKCVNLRAGHDERLRRAHFTVNCTARHLSAAAVRRGVGHFLSGTRKNPEEDIPIAMVDPRRMCSLPKAKEKEQALICYAGSALKTSTDPRPRGRGLRFNAERTAAVSPDGTRMRHLRPCNEIVHIEHRSYGTRTASIPGVSAPSIMNRNAEEGARVKGGWK